MSVDPDLLTISQVCRQFPGARGARHVTPSTVTRWILAGCPARDGARVRLAATRCGARWLIRPADLDVFFAALAADPAPPAAPPRSPTARANAAERAAHTLEKLGA
jgi:hypothetical protein